MTDRRIEIGDASYQLRDWSPDDGDRWFFRIGKLFLTSSTAARADGFAAAIGMVASLDEATWIALRDVVVKYTDLVSRAEDGRELVQPLGNLKTHLRGRQDVLVALMHAHLEAQFAGPFSRVVARLGGTATTS